LNALSGGKRVTDLNYVDEPDPAYALEADDDEPAEQTKPMRPVSRWLVRALILFMAGQTANAALAAGYFLADRAIAQGYDPDAGFLQLLSAASPIVWIGFVATLAVAGVCYLRFIYRAVANARKFSSRYMPDSPIGSVIWHFVPGLSLVKPYQIMRRVWIRSHNRASDDGEGPPAGGAWWMTWLVLNLAGACTAFLQNTGAETEEQAAAILNQISVVNVIGSLAGIASAIFLIPIVKGVAEAQDFPEQAKVFDD
jgi:hypothetical protein